MNICSKKLIKCEQQIHSKVSARKFILSGQVQGVGFRPFIYRIANTHNINGWVRNCLGIVEIHAQGDVHDLGNFLSDIFNKSPKLAKPKLELDAIEEVTHIDTFTIQNSESNQNSSTHRSVPTDLFLCDDCLSELNNPNDRRYRYPFINCTQCGPRYTIIQSLPYDRPNTTMAPFPLCPQCKTEYSSPENRRFHAEPVACPVCGPSLSFHSNDTNVYGNEVSLEHAVNMLQQGKTVAIKGIGGYHLICDATNTKAITKLRDNKPRADKPLAVLFPSPANAAFLFVEQCVELNEQDKAFLLQAARPILLLKKKLDTSSFLSEMIAPNLDEIGVMLPYSPLHHLLLNDFGRPLIATSANLSGEPVLTDNTEVEQRLSHVADAFLHHNRNIERPADDPVYRNILGKPRVIRGGRGSTPLEIDLPFTLQHPILAIGAHMKNTVMLAWENHAVMSPHIGEMNSLRSLEVFENTINELQNLYAVTAQTIICDAHPGYSTTRWAQKQNKAIHHIYHHHAHASAAYYECNTEKPVLIFAWDGVGYGEDETLWGGETLLGRPANWQRVGSMQPFFLPGADKAGREPWRSAAALCWEKNQPYHNIPETDSLLKQAWSKRINSPQSSSVGRLFDAAAALTDVCTQASFEGQGPMMLEALANTYKHSHNESLLQKNIIELPLKTQNTHHKPCLISDWAPLLSTLLDENLSKPQRAYSFHASLANNILQQALFFREEHSVNMVSFSGGVFQNRVLTELAINLLNQHGFKVSLAELIPINDASISFGQVIEYGYTQDKSFNQVT